MAALAGLVRGFSGFGSALIYMPLIAAVYSPRVAASTLLLIDTLCSPPFALQAMPQCNWREVVPVSVAGAVALPFGVMALVLIDPLLLRWLIAVMVLLALLALATGWRITAARRLSPRSASARWPDLAAGRSRSASRLCWCSGWRQQQCRHRARQHHGLFHRARRAVVRDLFLQQLVYRANDRIGVAAGTAVRGRNGGRRVCFHGASDALYRRVADSSSHSPGGEPAVIRRVEVSEIA